MLNLKTVVSGDGITSKLVLGTLTCTLLASVACAQTLEETLNDLSADAAKEYLLPVASAFGTDLNAGWFHRSPKPEKFGFDLEVGFVMMGAMFPDDAKDFSTSGHFQFSQDMAQMMVTQIGAPAAVQNELIAAIVAQPATVTISGATIIGDAEDYITVTWAADPINVQGTDYALESAPQSLGIGGFGDLADVSMMPLAAPQFSLGTLYGTQATFRFLPPLEINEDLGKFTYFGFGLQHNPLVWVPDLIPLDVSASFFVQNLKIGDLFKTKTSSFGINASKQFGMGLFNFTPYAGLMFESSKMEVEYDYIVDTGTGTPLVDTVSFELEGENKSRFTLGISLKALIFNLNADYNIGKYNSFSVGLNFII